MINALVTPPFQVENLDLNMALTINIVDNTSATYVTSLLDTHHFPYCQRGEEECLRRKQSPELAQFKLALKEFRAHADEGIHIHSAHAFCRTNQSSVGCWLGGGLSPNCPIQWGVPHESVHDQWV